MNIRIETNWRDWTEVYVGKQLIYSGPDTPSDLMRTLVDWLRNSNDIDIVTKDF